MPYPPQGAGIGDMTKAVYDPNDDGKIAVAQLVAAVLTDTQIADLFTAHIAEADAHHPVVIISNGSYTGNSSVNRAIAHELGVTPRIVFIIERIEGVETFRVFGGVAMIYYQAAKWDVGAGLAVTAPNSTNFYVGNSPSYVNSANLTGDEYSWVAIG